MRGTLRAVPSKDRLAAVCLLASVGAVVAIWSWHIQPARNQTNASRAQMVIVRAEIEEGLVIARRLRRLKEDVAQSESNLDEAREALKATPSVAELLRQIEDTAVESGLVLRKFTPQPLAKRQVLNEWPIGLQLEGTYHGFVTFLQLLSQSMPVLAVDSIHMRGRESGGRGITVTVDCTAIAFAFNDTDAHNGIERFVQEPHLSEASVVTPVHEAYEVSTALGRTDPRRDPFVSLLRRRVDSAPVVVATRPTGLAGIATAEVALKGTVKSPNGDVAVIQGTDSKTYLVRSGDKLLDGVIRTVTDNSLLIVQQVDGGVVLDKQREIWKVLRQSERPK